MSGQFDAKGFQEFKASLADNVTMGEACARWYRMSYGGRLAWGARAIGAVNAPEPEDVVMDDEKWTHVTVRLRPEERAYLESVADRNSISLSALGRSIMVDAIAEERERDKRLASRKSAAPATPDAPKDVPSPVGSTAD